MADIRVITIDREYGSDGGDIAVQLAKRLDAWIEKLDLELSIDDGQVLPNELIHAWLGNSAIASLDEEVARLYCVLVAESSKPSSEVLYFPLNGHFRISKGIIEPL